MTVTLHQAQRYAQLKKTKVIEGAYKIHEDKETITFVMESGPKLTFTSKELTQEIAELEGTLAKEQAILAINAPEPKPKADKKPKPKAET